MDNINIMDTIINKGVPISTPVILRYCDLHEICNDKLKFETAIDEATKIRNIKLNKIVNMQDIFVYKSMSIKINPDTLKKELVFSSAAFLYAIYKYLNVDNIYILENEDDYNFDYINLDFDKLIPRIKRLREIRDSHKLKREFPALYDRYLKVLDTYKQLRELDKKISSSKLSKEAKEKLRLDTIKSLEKYINVKLSDNLFIDAKRFDVISFCKSYADRFDDIVSNKEEICELLENETISLDDISMDTEKLELYLAYRFLENINDKLTDDKQKYVYYLANYFKENPARKSDDTLIIDIPEYDGMKPGKGIKTKEIISPKSIYIKFRQFIINNPNIQLLDFNDVDFSKMTLEEVETFIEEYLKTFKANWEIIPKSIMSENVIGPRNGNNKPFDYEKLNELFMEKKEFYSSLDPFMCIKGKKTFEGYIGYIFTNGIVVLDKFYENSKKGKVSRGDAIYYMNVQDFYELSRYPKKELIHHPKVHRVIHRGSWKDEVLDAINSNGDGMFTSNEMHKLIKTKEVQVDN